MCGRYVQVSTPGLLAEHFHVDDVNVAEHPADYNVTPRREVPAVRVRDEHRALDELRWGLVPSWAKDSKIGDRLINARAETVASKPAYKHVFKRKRCLIPADGFYEWQVLPHRKQKQPMFIHARDGMPLAFAGLWDAWRDRDDPDAPWIASCVIITTAANELMRPIHDRMPVILAEPSWTEWLDPANADVDRLQALLVPAREDVLEAWPVSTRVNNPKNNDAALTEREPESSTLFS